MRAVDYKPDKEKGDGEKRGSQEHVPHPTLSAELAVKRAGNISGNGRCNTVQDYTVSMNSATMSRTENAANRHQQNAARHRQKLATHAEDGTEKGHAMRETEHFCVNHFPPTLILDGLTKNNENELLVKNSFHGESFLDEFVHLTIWKKVTHHFVVHYVFLVVSVEVVLQNAHQNDQNESGKQDDEHDRVDHRQPVDFERLGEEFSLQVFAVVKRHVGFDPIHRVRKFNVQRSQVVIERDRMASGSGNVGRDDPVFVVCEGEVQRSPQVATLNVWDGNQAALFEMTHEPTHGYE